MQRTLALIGALSVLLSASALADDKDKLIAMDKQWGESTMKGDMSVAKKLLADSAVAVSDTGVRGKADELADSEPAPAGAKYEPTDYKVTFLDPNTAIMTHSTKGPEPHNSLHVWRRQGDAWQVVATSSTPAAKGE